MTDRVLEINGTEAFEELVIDAGEVGEVLEIDGAEPFEELVLGTEEVQ